MWGKWKRFLNALWLTCDKWSKFKYSLNIQPKASRSEPSQILYNTPWLVDDALWVTTPRMLKIMGSKQRQSLSGSVGWGIWQSDMTFVSKLEDHRIRTQNTHIRQHVPGVTIGPCSRTWHVGSGVRWPNVCAARLHLERPSAGWKGRNCHWMMREKKTPALLGLDLSKSAIAAPIWLAACMYPTGYSCSGKT